MKLLRHLGFYLCSFLWFLVLSLGFLVVVAAPVSWSVRFSKWWTAGMLTLARIFLGITYRITGVEHLPPSGSYLVACKHQSLWETLVMNLVVQDPVFFFKKTLLYVPFFGWFLWKLKMVVVARGQRPSGKNFLSLVKDNAIARGRPLVIFPEGTRTVPGTRHPYHRGVYAIYKVYSLTVVPAAVNSGYFWPKHAFYKHPGCITLAFLPAVPEGLPKEDFMSYLVNAIETHSSALLETAKIA